METVDRTEIAHDLPHEALRAVEAAAGRVRPGTELTAADFALLARAGRSGVMEPARFAALVTAMGRGNALAEAPREAFDLTMDYLFGFGFRDPALPEIGDDYRAFVVMTGQALGFDDDAMAEIVAEIMTERPDLAEASQMTGEAFVLMLNKMASRRGLPFPRLPERHYMTRAELGAIHAGFHRLGLEAGHYFTALASEGGGCLRGRDLDRTGAQRVLARLFAAGYVANDPPPRVEPRPGFVRQPQVNLIWKLAHDVGIRGEAAITEWLHTVASIEGGLSALTAAGACWLLDRMVPAAIAMRGVRAG